MFGPTRLILAVVCALILLCGVAGASWHLRGTVAERDLLQYQAELRKAQDDQRLLTAKAEAADTTNTRASSARIDVADQQHQTEVQYVTREVVRYVASPAAGKRQLPADWVRLYNQSSGLPGGVPETGATGPQADGTGR